MWRVWGRGEGCTGFWWGNLREIDNLEHLGTDRIDIKIDVKEMGQEKVDWIRLAQDWAVVNTVRNFFRLS